MQNVPIQSVRGNDRNPRKLDKEKFQKLVQSIKDFPEMLEKRPLVVADGVILGGNMRHKAAIEAGLKEIPIIDASEWTDKQKEQFIIKDNLSFGEWDWDVLANEWDPVQLEEWGLDVWQPDAEPAEGLTDPDDVPELPEEPKTKLGDLYILGEHRLLCGDSTKAEDVERLMDGKHPDIVITDPPYGIDAIVSSGVLSSRYEQYENEEDDSCALSFISMCINFGWNIIVFGGNYFAHALPKSTHWLIWDKRGADMKGGSANGDQSDCEIAWSNLKKKNVKIYKHVWAGWFREGNKKDELPTKVHPSQKPVGLFATIFDDYKFNIFFDGFVGSGSTLIAAEKTGRTCYGMELDPKYCDVIVKRWEDFTGKKAERVTKA